MTGGTGAQYGPWGIVAGGSDGTGIAFGHEMAARGINVVLVARREAVLSAAAAQIRARHDTEVRTVTLDLGAPGAIARLEEETGGTRQITRRSRHALTTLRT